MSPTDKNVKQRRQRNQQVALNAAEVGMAILLTRDCPDNPDKDRKPLWPEWKRLDGEISNTEKLSIAQKRGSVPTHYGSTRDVETIKRLFREFPDALPAACAGLNGLIVIDADTKKQGVEKLTEWLAVHGHVIPDATPITKTQRGGWHLVFIDGDGHSNATGDLNSLGCDVRGKGGYFMLPGVQRSNGASYTQMSESGLFTSFGLGTIPHLPSYFKQAIESGSTSKTSTSEAELGPILAEIDAADPDGEARFDPANITDDDKSGNHSVYRISVANRMRKNHPDATVQDYLQTLVADPDRAGVYVGSDKAETGVSFNRRSVARDWLNAGQYVIHEKIETDKAEARTLLITKAFGDIRETLVSDALAALRRSVLEGREADGDDLISACRQAGAKNMTPIIDALSELPDAMILDLEADALDAIEVAALKALEPTESAAEGSSEPPAHYIEAKAASAQRKASKNTPFEGEDQWEAERLMSQFPTLPLVDGLLDLGTISVVYGVSNVGKSFVAAHLAYCVAAGVPWLGREATRGAVCYFALEGRTAFRRRVAALSRAIDPSAPAKPAAFFTATAPALDLKSPAGDATRIIATILQLEARGEPVRLLVIDTLAAATPGMDESGASDMTAFVEELKRIRAACLDVHIMVVHHAGKDAARGARGHSSLRAAIDTEVEITAGLIAVTKQRDMEFAADVGFRLQSVDLGNHERGRAMKTAIVPLFDPKASRGQGLGDVSAQDRSDELAKLLPDQRCVFDGATAAITAAGGQAVTPAAIVAEVQKSRTDLNSASIRKTVTRRLVALDLLERVGERYRLPSYRVFERPDEA